MIIRIWELSLLVCAGSFGAGLLGSLTGLGGGIVIVPLLTIAFGVDIKYAIGASLVSVLATSSGAAIAHTREAFTNIRIGIFLEIAATSGALVGAYVTGLIPHKWIALIFGLVLLHSAYASIGSQRTKNDDGKPDRISTLLHLDGNYLTRQGMQAYHIKAVPWGFGMMFIAGVLSGLLGIGSGALKVIGMDRIMKIPFKVSTATSSLMIGITAAASAGIYFNRGNIDPGLAMPVMIGVVCGSFIGARFLAFIKTKWLRIVFAITIAFLGVEMIYKALSGKS